MLFYVIGCNSETKYYLYMNLNCMYYIYVPQSITEINLYTNSTLTQFEIAI